MLILKSENWQAIIDIHWRAKRGLPYVRDLDQYGQREYWAIPKRFGVGADCEDFDLWCSQRLIDVGIGWEHQAIAYCKTETGGGHAVLLLKTDRGTYVIDNREKVVRPYAHTKNRYEMKSQSQWGESMKKRWLNIKDD